MLKKTSKLGGCGGGTNGVGKGSGDRKPCGWKYPSVPGGGGERGPIFEGKVTSRRNEI